LIPNKWNISIINPIAKPGKDCRIPKNTRPISLVSTIYKLFASILNNRLIDYIDENQLLSDEQNGFRRLRSCVDHLYVLITVLKERKKNKQDTFACFVDFARAFDSIDHDLLVYKLIQKGIDGKFLNILKNSYKSMCGIIRLNGYMTNSFNISSGVRQGDVLSPTLFGLYIDDLVHDIKQLNCGVMYDNINIDILLYADDIILLSNSPEGLQSMLNTLGNWCKKWRLVVNNSKTNVIHFRREGQNVTNFNFTLWNQPVAVIETYRYLGLVVNEFMDITKTVQVLINAASRAYGSMLNKHFQIDGFTYDTYVKLYNALVIPVLTYGSSIWGNSNYQKCETLQHRVMRTFLGSNKATPIPALYADLGWTPISIITKLETVRYWHKLCILPDDRLTKQVFNSDFKLNSGKRGSWCYNIKSI